MSRRRVLALAGSLRRGSLNRRLLEAAVELAPPGIELVVYDALAEVPLFDEDLEQATDGGPEGVRRLRAAIAGADAVVIATPEYNQSIPGVLKNALDWLSRGPGVPVLEGKPVAVVGVTAGRWGTRLAQAALRQVLFAMEARVLPAPNLYLANGGAIFDADGRLTDPSTTATLGAILERLASFIERPR